MKKVAIVGCGAYMDSGYGCPGEWRCLKAAALGEHSFDEPSQVVAFIKCECPGRAAPPINIGPCPSGIAGLAESVGEVELRSPLEGGQGG